MVHCCIIYYRFNIFLARQFKAWTDILFWYLQCSYLVLTIFSFNKGACLTFKSLFHIMPSIYFLWLWNRTQICSWNQPALSNDGKVSCSRKQCEPLMRFKPKTDRGRLATRCAMPAPCHTKLFIKSYVMNLISKLNCLFSDVI